jgi:anti-anti-sigma factor
MESKETEDQIEIHLNGELDTKAVLKIRDEILKTAETSTKAIKLNMQDVLYIDSAAINLLISLHRIQEGKNSKLLVANLNPSVERILKLGSLDKILHLI